LTSETNFTQRRIPFKQFREYLSKLESAGMLHLYRDIELPLVDILIEMQENGARIDLKALDSISQNLQSQIGELTARIFEFAGENFNINSPQQLGGILFKKLGLETTRKTKTGWSTDEWELSKKAGSHPIVPQILRYRKVFKLYSTYIQGYKNLADANGFVHTTFNNTATVTGRLSSSEPNLQNIPARSDDAERIRKLFTSRFPGGKIISADYNQIELRLLAHFAQDPVMLAAFRTGRDIHTETAMKVFEVTAAAVTPDMRRKAKAVNFGIVYGISSFGLSESIGCSVSQAGNFIDKYFREFHGVKNFLDKSRDKAIAKGYATTLLGRRRILKELSSTNQQTVGFGMRAAINMPMQGSASDIIKSAMVTLKDRLGNCLLIAQVHDELIFDCPPEQVESASKIIKETMENIVQLSVPLTVNIETKETF
jgi:DNA polymerase-1